MTIERTRRPLTPAERRLIETRLRRTDARLPGFRGMLVAGAFVFFPLWAVTMLVSDLAWWMISAFWIGIALLVLPSSALSARRELRSRMAALRSALDRGEADTVRIRARGFVEFEEIEDLGQNLAVDVGEDEVLFLSGQDLFDMRRFPNSDFTLAEVSDGDGRVVESWVIYDGERVAPLRRVSAEAQRRLELPGHLETRQARLEDLETLLDRDAAAGGSNLRSS